MGNENKTGFWSKTAGIAKKAADSAKNLADQTKKAIHDQQAKRYTTVTEQEFKSADFKRPLVIEIEEDGANREFVTDENAIGWIETHKGVPVLHMYHSYAEKSGIVFVPAAFHENVYYNDNFDKNKYIIVDQVFGKATEEKLAELNNIAYCIGAKSCSIEIIEAETSSESRFAGAGGSSAATVSKSGNRQSGKSTSEFVVIDDPQYPTLKWFAHDDNVKGLIDKALKRSVKAHVLRLEGSSSATMTASVACAIDSIKPSGTVSLEKESQKEHSKTLIFEVMF